MGRFRLVLVRVYSQSVLPMVADTYCVQSSSKVLVFFPNFTASKVFLHRHDPELLVSFRSSFAVSQ